MSEKTLIKRLRERAQAVLDFVFKVEGARGLVSIPRSADDVDAMLCEAADALSDRDARIAALEEGLRSFAEAAHVGCTCTFADAENYVFRKARDLLTPTGTDIKDE